MIVFFAGNSGSDTRFFFSEVSEGVVVTVTQSFLDFCWRHGFIVIVRKGCVFSYGFAPFLESVDVDLKIGFANPILRLIISRITQVPPRG